jgi:hypothetical protein
MSKSIILYILGTILIHLLYSVAEENNSEYNYCSDGTVPDGFGGCNFQFSPNDECEWLYGACDCYGDSTCCTQDECLIVCGPASSGYINSRCTPPGTTIVPTIPTETTTLAHNKCLKK